MCGFESVLRPSRAPAPTVRLRKNAFHRVIWPRSTTPFTMERTLAAGFSADDVMQIRVACNAGWRTGCRGRISAVCGACGSRQGMAPRNDPYHGTRNAAPLPPPSSHLPHPPDVTSCCPGLGGFVFPYCTHSARAYRYGVSSSARKALSEAICTPSKAGRHYWDKNRKPLPPGSEEVSLSPAATRTPGRQLSEPVQHRLMMWHTENSFSTAERTTRTGALLALDSRGGGC